MKVRAALLALVSMVLVASVTTNGGGDDSAGGRDREARYAHAAGRSGPGLPRHRGGQRSVPLGVEDKRHPGNDDIYGQRLDPDGNRLGAPFAISTAAGGQFCPRAAWSGSAGWSCGPMPAPAAPTSGASRSPPPAGSCPRPGSS